MQMKFTMKYTKNKSYSIELAFFSMNMMFHVKHFLNRAENIFFSLKKE